MPEPLRKRGLLILSERCERCLFGTNPLVDADAVRDILERCRRSDTHFECHAATSRKLNVICGGYWESGLPYGPAARLARARPKIVEMQSVSLAELLAAPVRDRSYARSIQSASEINRGKKMPRWPDTSERDEQILLLRDNEISAGEIGKQMGCSVATVRRVISAAKGLQKQGRKEGTTSPAADALRAQARLLEKEGKATAEIAKALKRSESLIRKYLNAVKRAEAMQLAKDGRSNAEIARLIGCSEDAVIVFLSAPSSDGKIKS